MIRIAVVDDQNEICACVEKMLIEISKEQCIMVDIDVYDNGRQFCEHLMQNEFYDLVILDIEMDDFSGIDVSNTVRKVMKNEATQIAYISGNKDYALEIFDFDPLYFLHKPINREKIEKVFLKLIDRLHLKAEAFSYKSDYETIKVPMKDIIYFESDDHQVYIYYYVQNTCKRDCFYGSLDHVEKQLQVYQFLRIHKSYLVNPIHIKKYTYKTVQMSEEMILPIAQSKRKEIRIFQFNLMDD